MLLLWNGCFSHILWKTIRYHNRKHVRPTLYQRKKASHVYFIPFHLHRISYLFNIQLTIYNNFNVCNTNHEHNTRLWYSYYIVMVNAVRNILDIRFFYWWFRLKFILFVVYIWRYIFPYLKWRFAENAFLKLK